MIVEGQRANGFPLRFDLQVGECGVLRRLGGDDGDLGGLGIAQMRTQLRGEFCEVAHYCGFWFFGEVGAQSADRGLVAFGHVGICVPEPFDCAGALYE